MGGWVIYLKIFLGKTTCRRQWSVTVTLCHWSFPSEASAIPLFSYPSLVGIYPFPMSLKKCEIFFRIRSLLWPEKASVSYSTSHNTSTISSGQEYILPIVSLEASMAIPLVIQPPALHPCSCQTWPTCCPGHFLSAYQANSCIFQQAQVCPF